MVGTVGDGTPSGRYDIRIEADLGLTDSRSVTVILHNELLIGVIINEDLRVSGGARRTVRCHTNDVERSSGCGCDVPIGFHNHEVPWVNACRRRILAILTDPQDFIVRHGPEGRIRSWLKIWHYVTSFSMVFPSAIVLEGCLDPPTLKRGPK